MNLSKFIVLWNSGEILQVVPDEAFNQIPLFNNVISRYTKKQGFYEGVTEESWTMGLSPQLLGLDWDDTYLEIGRNFDKFLPLVVTDIQQKLDVLLFTYQYSERVANVDLTLHPTRFKVSWFVIEDRELVINLAVPALGDTLLETTFVLGKNSVIDPIPEYAQEIRSALNIINGKDLNEYLRENFIREIWEVVFKKEADKFCEVF